MRRLVGRVNHLVLRVYVCLCPVVSSIYHSTPGIPALLLITLLPR